MNITEPIVQSAPPPEEPRPAAGELDHHSGWTGPTVGELLQEVVPEAFVVAQAGPPVVLLFGPWLLLVLLLIPPAAFLITLVLVTVAAAAALVVLVALVASPYLLLRHLRARHATRRGRFPFALRRARAVRDRAPQPALPGWAAGPAAGVPAPHASFASQADGRQIRITQAKGTT
jgi:hypothetical protein